MRVDVLLATRNSARFLDPMLDSLAAQDHRDFHLIIGDDASSDDTLARVERKREGFANPVEVIARTEPSGSARANFSDLIERSRGDYVFLADHDDIWLSHKISTALSALSEAERALGADTPILFHTDLSVVDADGAPLADSLWRFKRLDPAAGVTFRRALVEATVTGCACAFNGALRRRLGRIPPEAVMHDWWIALLACGLGRVLYDPRPSIQYRIHGANVSNPQKVSFLRAALDRDRYRKMHWRFHQRTRQAAALVERHGDALPPSARRVAERFAAMGEVGPVTRRAIFLRDRFFVSDHWRNIAYMAFM